MNKLKTDLLRMCFHAASVVINHLRVHIFLTRYFLPKICIYFSDLAAGAGEARGMPDTRGPGPGGRDTDVTAHYRVAALKEKNMRKIICKKK